MKRFATAMDDKGQRGEPGEVRQERGTHIGDSDVAGGEASYQRSQGRIMLPVPALQSEVELDDEMLARANRGLRVLGYFPALGEPISPKHRGRHDKRLVG